VLNFRLKSFDWLVDLIILLGWIDVEVPLHSFPVHVEVKSDEIFIVVFCYHRMLE
jgi:hypothetical protein